MPYKGGSSGEVWFVEALGTPPFHVDPAHDPDTPFPHYPAPDKVLAPGNVCVWVWVCANWKLHERGHPVCSRTKSKCNMRYIGESPSDRLGGDHSAGPQQRTGAVAEGGPAHPDDTIR